MRYQIKVRYCFHLQIRHSHIHSLYVLSPLQLKKLGKHLSRMAFINDTVKEQKRKGSIEKEESVSGHKGDRSCFSSSVEARGMRSEGKRPQVFSVRVL